MYYKTVFNINFLHAYFLDEGNKKYASNGIDNILTDEEMTDEEKIHNLNSNERKEILKKFDINDYLKIIPVPNTTALVKNHRMMIVPNKQGIRLLITTSEETVDITSDGETVAVTKYKPIIQLNDNAVFTFAIYASDVNFNNYTTLEEVSENRLYLFSNEVNNLDTPITNIFTGDGIINEDYLLTDIDTRTIIQTIDSEEKNTIHEPFSITRIISLINENDTLSEAEKTLEIENILNKYISEQKRNGLIGYIRLKVNGDNTNDLFEYVDDNQYVIDNVIAFDTIFRNRNTFWRYINISDNRTLTTEDSQPLTKNGFVEIDKNSFNPIAPVEADGYQYPNPTATLIKEENSNYYSEIFI